MDKVENELIKILENTPIAFGLEAQGHISTIQNSLEEGRDWNYIAKEIGWEVVTAREYYERYMQRKTNHSESEVEISTFLAIAIQLLEKNVDNFNKEDSRKFDVLKTLSRSHLYSSTKK